MELSIKQALFIEAAKKGKNIFLTGKAGTGKSTIVKKLIEEMQLKGMKVAAIAPTGIAANNIGGQTIHSMFNINPHGVASFEGCNFVKGEKRKMLQSLDVIIIDEVSMLRPDVLDAMNWTLLKNGCSSIQSKQVIFIGDLKQLPPILDDNTRSVLYRDYDGEEFYYAKCYKKLDVINIELDEVLRQSDNEFIIALNEIREGRKSQYFKNFLSKEPRGVILAPHNSVVERYNREGLDKLKTESFTFIAEVDGNAKAEDFNLLSVINVKQGAKIMYLQNSKENDLCNGSIGIFVSYAGCHYIRIGEIDYALSQTVAVKIEYVLNQSKDTLELKEIGSIIQYPIKLAYALSIHKSQGLTFDEVTIDLSRPCFQKGQLYVALSRVKTPQGLTIIV